MKTKARVVLSCACLIAGVLVTFLVVSPPTASGQGVEPVPFRFSGTGFARSQSLQVNVAHVSGIQPCTAELSFADMEGNLILDEAGDVIAKTVRLLPGQSDFLVLSGRDVGTDGQRIFVRPVIEVVPVDPDVPSGIVASAEIFNTLTGRTVAIVGVVPPCDSAPVGR